MLFTTPVKLPTGEITLSHSSKILLAGSCFATNIGNKLRERKFDIECNPFGVQYNPLSISAVLRRIASGELFGETSPELFEHGNRWHSIMHHSDFSRNSKEELTDCINDRLLTAYNAVQRCDTVILTFGTAYVYTRKSDKVIAGNCHKLPANDFERRRLGITEIADDYSDIIEEYKRLNPGIRFLFTVSPIRHLRDGAHDNQKSKATLLLAIEEIIKRHPDCCHYFPAYEIVLDELRDYRFYAEDMTHPSATAIEYIWENFSKCYFDAETTHINDKTEEIARALAHRPFDEQSAGYKEFIKGVLNKISTLEKKHPHLDFEKEKAQCNTLLRK